MIQKLDFNQERNTDKNIKLIWNQFDDLYLQRLRKVSNLEDLISLRMSEIERVREVTSFVHNLWDHNGDNEPQKNDPISIIQEALNGKNFRCVEYSSVLSSCLNAIDIPSRLVALKTKDCETRAYGAGHVVVEAYLKGKEKWVMIDPQWNIITMMNGIPLNAVEFQESIYQQKEITEFSNIKTEYFNWIHPYLYYFTVDIDNRVGVHKEETHNEYKQIMLVPNGAKEPKLFQRRFPIKNVYYTNHIHLFYQQPIL
ncbi:transglutaminase-like domain-containing protein [Chengkuizengella axinellae]|uniref:Transglutaminase-like domain-containing protein n=1 Tax=Chengkuizengella axinellae TaxID=3064388 RepID=A0ABT9IU72_9BACL|nr:transglutaminase-like domain-containing protein [Chengkuizengella sp. 2205SS18-9]MDP5272833.1 transglutaminase-like domain-containing protein [Chengkuizengella sp. 2205SS18-9]